MPRLRVAACQLNLVVGDLDGNVTRILSALEEAEQGGADVAVFPELAVTGYPPEDLLLRTHFLEAARAALEELAGKTEGIAAVVGFPEREDDVYNAAALLAEGEIETTYRKMLLPNYGVFDEQRYFQAGDCPVTFELNGVEIGLTVCEDIWEPGPPATAEALAGAQLIVNCAASPYHAEKGIEREHMVSQRARDNSAAVAFCNLVGGQDELVFDGHSVVVDQEGALVARAPQFQESLTVCTIDPDAVAAERLRNTRRRAAVRRVREHPEDSAATLAALEVEAGGRTGEDGRSEGSSVLGGPQAELMESEEEVWGALELGLRDYVEKNGFPGVVLALSGGIDSACCAVIAVDALGPERVTCVIMPSRYSSEGTQRDARAIAGNLGAHLVELPIDDTVEAYDRVLAEPFADTEPDIAEENIQARIRGNLIMALSNKFGLLALTTSNKSEAAVGYTTLYGDMAGGFSVLKDVYKGWVYRLVRWRNARAEWELVPESVLERAPSAELRFEQRDEDSLPAYERLDRILTGYVEGDLDARQLARQGLTKEEVERVVGMVDAAEYKRRQSAPGVRITTRAFGRDRRLPITNRFRG